VGEYYGRPGVEHTSRGGLSVPFTLLDEPVAAHPGAHYDGYTHAFGGMAVQFVLFMGLEAGLALLLDRRRGVWDRLRAASLSRATLLGARATSSWLLSLLAFTTVLGFGAAVFGIRVAGSGLGFAALLLATSAMATTFGLCLAALGGTPETARGLGIFATLVMAMLGGAWFPAFLFPAWMQKATLAIPTRWAMDGLDAMSWRGFPLAPAAGPLSALVGFTLLFGLVAWVRFRWE